MRGGEGCGKKGVLIIGFQQCLGSLRLFRVPFSRVPAFSGISMDKKKQINLVDSSHHNEAYT
jgi:hypothetical protein